jgi:hypothetical protein
MTEVVQGWQRMWDAGLWDRFHTPLKVAWADMLLHQMLGAKYGYTEGLPALDKLMGRMGLTKKLGEYTDEQIARSVMSFVNDEMGGQNWALHTKNSFMRAISDERVLEIMSSQFLSPDWNTSAIRVATAAADFKDPVRQALGVKHWVYSGMSWYLLANSINYMMTGHHMWDNAPGRRLHHIELPFKSAEGKQLYINIYKQFREGPEFALNALRFIQRKQRGLVRLAQSGEEDSSGFKTRVGEYIAQQFKEGRETVEPMEYGFFLLDALEQFIPFMLRGTARGAGHGETFPQKAVLALLSQWFPVSTGLNMRDGEVLLAEAMRDGDTDQIMTVVVSLQANGYPTSEIRKTLSRARNKARKYQ